MAHNCKCGGRYVPTGHLKDAETGDEWATFTCDKCGKETLQKLRKPNNENQHP
jgi:hypothetical protein